MALCVIGELLVLGTVFHAAVEYFALIVASVCTPVSLHPWVWKLPVYNALEKILVES